MRIETVEGGGTSYFLATEDDGAEVGRTEFYTTPDGAIAITYVGVSPRFRGQGKGEEFVAKIVEYARDKGVCVQPFCGFSRAVFSKRPDLRDVLP